MFRRKRVVQDVVVADSMRRFFGALKASDRAVPEFVAHRYGEHLFGRPGDLLSDELSRSRYYVGISTGNSTHRFADLTRRATLVADTLLLAHDRTARYHEIGVQTRYPTIEPDSFNDVPMLGAAPSAELAQGIQTGYSMTRPDRERRNSQNTAYGMHCTDLRALGTWILDAEPLLTAGLTWYLPTYSLHEYTMVQGIRHDSPEQVVATKKALDFLIRDGRAVDASGADPIKSKLVRPVLHTELPFLQGVSLRDFSRITVEEFGSFVAFRDFLRLSLLGLDDALNDVQSEREMLKIGLKINDEMRSMRAEMVKAQRKRALSASGAVLGAAGTVLLAVYGPALATAIAALGASGGVWGFISAMSEGGTTVLRENKWYYVWALATSSPRDG